MAKDSSQLAKRFIDTAIKKQSKPPSKAAYARAIKLARRAIDELALVASRVQS